jgi:hypothetical protein
MPVEVIFPSDDAGGYEYFQDKVLAINAARNNNAELTQATKANKMGFYEEIKGSLDKDLIDHVEWKANSGGRIKAQDLVSLALIPLSKLNHLKAPKRISQSPAVLFSSKGQCIQIYNDLMDENGVVKEVKGTIVAVVDPKVKSALSLMADMPGLFDLIYERLPEAYNAAGGRFGKIDSVKIGKFKTRFYRRPCGYSYGEGYIYPLLYGLTAIMKVEGNEVRWSTDPGQFIKAHFNGIMKSFYSMITGQNFDPAKVGKAAGAYNLAVDLFASAFKDEILREHGLA